MPPKKKKGKKSAGKRSAKDSKSKANVAVEEALNELGKEFYLVQIRDLEARINRYQKKCDELEIKNMEYKSNSEQQAADKKEIVTFLKKQLEHRADEIADLQERLIGLQQAKDTEKDQYEVQLATLRTEMQETKDQLTSEIMVLGGRLASLEEFRIQRDDLYAKFAKLEQELVQKEEDHKEQMYKLEKKSVVDKDRLKKEMILRVNTVAAEFRKVSNKQMAETTKRTLRENVSINAQLSKMSDKTMELIQENDELREKEKTREQHSKVLEFNETEILKKNASNQKLIRMLTAKGKELQEQVIELQKREKELVESVNDLSDVQKESDDLRIQAYDKEKKAESLQEALSRAEQEIKDLLKERDQLVLTISQCGRIIKETVQLNEESNVDLALDPALQEMTRSNMLQRLLTVMDVAVGLGEGLEFTELSRRHPNGSEQAMRSLADSLKKKRLGPFAHYKPGDLGLVPTVNHKHLSSLDQPVPRRDSRAIHKKSFRISKQISLKDDSIASGVSDTTRFHPMQDGRSLPTHTKLPAL